MVRVIITHTVQSFDDWLPVYNGLEKARANAGSTGGTVHRGLEDPNEVTVIADWPDMAAFDRFAKEADLPAKMKEGGVVSEPAILAVGDAEAGATDL